jgi:hypothetical protein
MLRGWHANNGVMLGCLGLGFVCTGQTVDGDPGLEGYYIEHDRDLAEHERLRFARGERMPRFDPATAPHLPAADWPAERIAKAKRGYAMEYCRTALQEAVALFGPIEGGHLLGLAARLVAMQLFHETAAALGATGQGFAAFLRALFAASGDAAEVKEGGDGIAVTVADLALLRGIAHPHDAMIVAWAELMTGALAAHDRFARIERTGPLAWRISG